MGEAGQSVRADRVFDLGPRLAWACLTLGVGLIAAMEIIGVAALLFALLPATPAAVLTAALLTPSLIVLVVMASALSGRIVVGPGVLTLRFGLIGGADVPRSLITRAERFDPTTALTPIGLGIDVPFGSGRATVTRGGPVHFVRVTLRSPARVRLTVWRHAVANELVLSTSRPDELVSSLI
ncbi:hypothetical protein [Kineosporia succinea]|uniref:PH (Pleckstrin Homology) domain-containing protein n=1 Tax=Kineosporia succinea TaxID=84632 RepID=A0ABT9P2J6_9ACTN|nr:hypothetical protein [Kineosporia succinea]MDP9826455.1 hypothetical protein [Kineosporia succinea]